MFLSTCCQRSHTWSYEARVIRGVATEWPLNTQPRTKSSKRLTGLVLVSFHRFLTTREKKA